MHVSDSVTDFYINVLMPAPVLAVVVNGTGQLDTCVAQVSSIIAAEKAKVSRRLMGASWAAADSTFTTSSAR